MFVSVVFAVYAEGMSHFGQCGGICSSGEKYFGIAILIGATYYGDLNLSNL